MTLTRKHYNILGITAICFWSLTVAMGRSLTEQLGPLTTVAAIFLLGGTFSLLLTWFRSDPLSHLRNASRSYLICCGLLFLVYMMAFFLSIGKAVDRKQVLELGLINYLWPSLTIVFSVFILKKKASWMLLPATLLALAGIFFVLTQKGATTGGAITWGSFVNNVQTNPVAYGLALVAGISWGLYSNLTNLFGGSRDVNAVPFFMLFTGIFFLILRIFFPENTVFSGTVVVELGVLSFFTASAYVLWDYALRKGNVVFVAVCSYFTPLLSTLVSCIYLNITTTLQLWAGCLMIIVGSLLSWKSIRK